MIDWLCKPRIMGLLLFVPTMAVVLIALSLEPDPTGMGTHHQLGLSPCTFWLWCSLPCPMCGMTTTFSHMAHLQIGEAFLTQPFGVVLFLCMIVVLCIGGVDLISGKGVYKKAWRWFIERESILSKAIVCGLLLGWFYKLWRVGM